MSSADTGDLITLSRHSRTGIYNNSGADVQCFFCHPDRPACRSVPQAAQYVRLMKWRAHPQILR